MPAPPEGLILNEEQLRAWQAVQADLAAVKARLARLERTRPGDVDLLRTRPEFTREVARMLAYDERYGCVSSVVYFDVMGLAEKEDSLRDSLAQWIGETLLTHVRGCDIVARLAPDEFGVFLVRCGHEDADKKARMLTESLAPHLRTFGLQDIGFETYSFGEPAGETAQVASRMAEQAMQIVAPQTTR